MRYGCYANGFRFDSRFANFRFSPLRVSDNVRVKVRLRVYLVHLICFYQVYYTLIVRYYYVTGGI